MESKINYLFVYGSLRKYFQVDVYTYISNYFTLLGNAKVKGKLYYTGEYPAAVPAPDESFVIGELYELKKDAKFASAIGPLDDYERADPLLGEEWLFRRELTTVIFDGTTTEAWIYWFNGSVDGKISIPSGDILDYICR